MRTYDDLWREAYPGFCVGSVQIDPLLRDRKPDARRGLTVIFRPPPMLTTAVTAWLADLATLEPAQYRYAPEQLHVTVLSLFTATPAFAPYFARLPHYLAALDAALTTRPAFTVSFRGITASRGAVMVQGFPADAALEQSRAALRHTLADAGFGDDLDQRYRLTTAHMTALRICAPLAAPAAFAAALAQARTRHFGVTQVNELLLVENDWYMTPSVVRVVRRYPLTSTQPT